MKFKIDLDWNQIEGYLPIEERFTLASIKMTVDNENIFEYLEENTKHDSLHVSTLPLCEWLAGNWWRVFYEDYHKERTEIEESHRLKFANAGYLWPDIVIYRKGSYIFIEATKRKENSFEFFREGIFSIHHKTFEKEVRNLIEKSIKQLRKNKIQDSELENEWKKIQKFTEPEKNFCIACGTLGYDCNNISPTKASNIIKGFQYIPDSLIHEVAQSLSKTNFKKELNTINEIVTYDYSSYDDHFSRLREEVNEDSDILKIIANQRIKPWNKGYRLAEKLRTLLNKKTSLIEGDTEDLLNSFTNSDTSPEHIHKDISLSNIKSIVKVNERKSPVFISFHSRTDQQKFWLSHAVSNYLFSTLDVTNILIVSDYLSAKQQMHNAFAAEWLAPKKSLKGLMKKDASIEKISYETKIPNLVLKHQLENHNDNKELSHSLI